MENRKKYIDIAKGIGIIMVVWAHTGAPLTEYVVQMHMPLFFLISGFLYSDRKNVKTYIWGKVKSLYIPFVFWNIIGLVFWSVYSHKFLVKQIVLVLLTLTKDGQLFGATWFLATLFQVTLIYRLTDYFLKGNKYKSYILLVLFSLAGIVGFVITLPLTLSRTLILSMFFAIGAFAKNKGISFSISKSKMITSISFTVLFFVIGYFNDAKMSANEYSNPVLFVIGATISSYALIYFSRCLEENKNIILSKLVAILSFIGRNSLDIVIWHFVAFRIVIVIQLILNGIELSLNNVFEYYPYYDNSNGWWIVYFIVGISIPLLICYLLRKTKVGKLMEHIHIL